MSKIILLAHPLAYGDFPDFRRVVNRYLKQGCKVYVDLHHWIDIPEITRRTLLIYKSWGVSGAVISETGGFVLHIPDFEIIYRSVVLAVESQKPC